jgi:hypothetical protein
MTVQITIKADFKRVKRFLSKVEKKQIPFATARAITQTLQIAKKDVLRQLDKDIRNATPFTRRAFFVEGAKKTNLTGRLFIRPVQATYLTRQIFGGVRKPVGAALALPPAKRLAGDIRRDRYGNLPRSQRAKALLSKGAISATIGGVAGIWRVPKRTKTGKLRKGQKLKLLLAYEPQAVYRPRFRFFERGQNSIRAHWPDIFDRSFRDALRTARR